MTIFSLTTLPAILTKKRNRIITCLILLFIITTVVLDYAEACFQQTGFYISESLLFSCFWLLFLPLLHFQLRLTRLVKTKKMQVAVIIPFISAHLFAYPALVWLLSALFYPHTFNYAQTLGFGFPQYFIILFFAYSIIPVMHGFYAAKQQPVKSLTAEPGLRQTQPVYYKNLLVTTANNVKVVIQARDILYIEARSPYVHLQVGTKKYVYNETLKNLVTQLNPAQFVRIHKSHIVNIQQVVQYKSRLNGDYDLLLSDNTTLRISRTYAAAFKACFLACHQVTV